MGSTAPPQKMSRLQAEAQESTSCWWQEDADAIALVAGNMIGGGILAIPTVSACAGFLPSTALLSLLWVCNVATGLCLAEAAGAAVRRGETDVSLRALSSDALGEEAAGATGVMFAVTNAALLAAYMAQGGDSLLSLATAGFGTALTVFHESGGGGAAVASEAASTSFAVTMCFRLAYGACAASLLALPEHKVDKFNTALVGFMSVVFALLLASWLPFVDAGNLLSLEPNTCLSCDTNVMSALGSAAPVLVSALVFQNVVPSVAKRFEGDDERTRRSLVAGSAVPLVCYVLFNAAVLGRLGPDALVPAAGQSLVDASAGLPADVAALTGAALQLFALAAVTTSFVGAAVSQLKELEPLFQRPDEVASSSASDDDAGFTLDSGAFLTLCAALVPPVFVALSGPDIFVPALALSGSIANPLLFGVLPPLLAWHARYRSEHTAELTPQLPGGKISLAGLSLAASTVVVNAAAASAQGFLGA